MPLTDHHRCLLMEIYGVTDMQEVYAAPGQSISSILPVSFSLTTPIVKQIDDAIASINTSPEKAARVETILAEYESISLDPSNIDREGYAFRLERTLTRIKALLRPYTGIFVGERGGSNITPVG